jgi:hypothetical protein
VRPRGPEASLNGDEAIATADAVVERIAGPGARRVTGWATVELDRAERDIAAGIAPGMATSRDLPDDVLLGAHCRLVSFAMGEPEVLLLEPATEGRIAASLARFDEGPVAVYVLVAAARLIDVLRDLRAAGLVLSAEGAGPFGREWLVAAPRWGAHLCIAEAAAAGAATIEP